VQQTEWCSFEPLLAEALFPDFTCVVWVVPLTFVFCGGRHAAGTLFLVMASALYLENSLDRLNSVPVEL
jgi:hypothetical protein